MSLLRMNVFRTLMGMYGSHAMSVEDGLLIEMDIRHGLTHGDGLGLTRSLGVLRLRIMDVGLITETLGCGFPAHALCKLTTHLH
jgi:hypothetical protein